MDAQLFEGLLTSGPLALALGIAVKVLWNDNQKLRSEKDAAHKEAMNILKALRPGDSSDGTE